MGRGSKHKQTSIEGTEPEIDAELDAAVADYVEARDARMEASKDEKKAKDLLLAHLNKRELKYYKTEDGYVARLQPSDVKLKVESPEAAPTGAGEDYDDDEVG